MYLRAAWFTYSWSLLLVLVFSNACRHDSAPNRPTPLSNEVWLTADQVKTVPILTKTIEMQTIDHLLHVTGKVSFDDMRVSHVYSPISGQVKTIVAELGAHVRAGEPLAVIESPDLGIASSDRNKAKADLVAARHQMKRTKELFEGHAGSLQDYEQARDNYARAKAELERSEQKMKLLQRQAGAFDVVTQRYTLQSEIEGQVLARSLSLGMEVQGQYTGGNPVELFTIGDLQEVWILADVYEIDMSRIKLGTKVNVQALAYADRTFSGQIDWISKTLDPITRTMKIRCRLPNPEEILKPEMFVSMSIEVESTKALAIPRSALLRLGDQTFVFVDRGAMSDGHIRFERVAVSVDETWDGPLIQVKHGLASGEQVVYAGALLLSGEL